MTASGKHVDGFTGLRTLDVRTYGASIDNLLIYACVNFLLLHNSSRYADYVSHKYLEPFH